ncbi:MAG: hypothetical protein ACYTF1_08880 [Planctomycetota bacterium]|jgi:hypothetical protein
MSLRKPNNRICPAILALLVSLSSIDTVFADHSWTGNAGDGQWSNPINWNPASVPGPNNDVNVYGIKTVALNIGNPGIRTLEMGGQVYNTININVGRQSANQHWFVKRWASIHAMNNKTGTVNIQSGDVIFDYEGGGYTFRGVTVGIIGNGVLTASGTAYVHSLEVYLGGNDDHVSDPGKSGKLILSGNAHYKCSNWIAAGYNGNGTIEIKDNALLEMYGGGWELTLGNKPGSTGALDQTGGTIKVKGNMVVGNDGIGTATLSTGQIDIQDDGSGLPKLIVARGIGSSGTFNLNGGMIYSKAFPDVDDDNQATSAVVNFSNGGRLGTRHTATAETQIRQAIIDGKFSNGVSSDPDHASWYIARIDASQNPYLHNNSPTDIWVVQSPAPDCVAEVTPDTTKNMKRIVSTIDNIPYTVTNAASGSGQSVTYTVTENPNVAWLTLDKTTGGPISPGNNDTVTATIDTNGIAEGNYTTDLEFLDSCGALHVRTVNLEVFIPDFDNDNDVDHEDFGHLQICMTGNGNAQGDPDCLDARLDDDFDVDLDDFNIFQSCMGGANQPPTCL